MPATNETLLLGFPNRWAAATFTATDERPGAPASNLALPQHDAPWLLRFYVPIDGQDETAYDNAPTTEGTFTGGSGYSANDLILLSDGSTATADAVAGGGVTEFTVDSSGSSGGVAGDTLTQVSVTPPGGSGFSLTLDVDNVGGASQSVVVDAGEAVALNAIRIEGARTTGFTAAELQVQIETASDAGFTTDVTDWTGGVIDFRMKSAASPVARLDMPQANVGPTDVELTQIETLGRFSHTSRRLQGFEVTRRYARVTFSHTGTPAAGQSLSIAHFWAGWAWQPELGTASTRFGSISEPNGRKLLAADLELQIVKSDALFARTWRQFFLPSGDENRGWIWWNPGQPEFYYENSFMGRFIDDPVSITGAGDAEAFDNRWALRVVERFSVETAT